MATGCYPRALQCAPRLWRAVDLSARLALWLESGRARLCVQSRCHDLDCAPMMLRQDCSGLCLHPETRAFFVGNDRRHLRPAKILPIQTPPPRRFQMILIGPRPDLQTRSVSVIVCSRRWRRNARRSSVELAARLAPRAASGRARLGAQVACAVLRGCCPTAVERPALSQGWRQGRSPTILWEETRSIGLCSQAKPFAEGKDPGPDPAEIL